MLYSSVAEGQIKLGRAYLRKKIAKNIQKSSSTGKLNEKILLVDTKISKINETYF